MHLHRHLSKDQGLISASSSTEETASSVTGSDINNNGPRFTINGKKLRTRYKEGTKFQLLAASRSKDTMSFDTFYEPPPAFSDHGTIFPNPSFLSQAPQDSTKLDNPEIPVSLVETGKQSTTSSVMKLFGATKNIAKNPRFFQPLQNLESIDANDDGKPEPMERGLFDGNSSVGSSTSEKSREDNKINKNHRVIAGFQRLDTIDSEDEFGEYEPPGDFFGHAKKSPVARDAEGVGDSEYEPPGDYLLQKQSEPPGDFFDVNRTKSPSFEDFLPKESENEAKNERADKDEFDDDKFETDSNEFQQFVFDKNFKNIVKVVTERSDSGAGDNDIFRMAAVATVRQHTDYFGSPLKGDDKPMESIPRGKSGTKPKPLKVCREKKQKTFKDVKSTNDMKIKPHKPVSATWNAFPSLKESMLGSQRFVAAPDNVPTLAMGGYPSYQEKSQPTDVSVFSTISNANATVSTGPKDESQKQRFLSFDDDDVFADPFSKNIMDDFAWDVNTTPFEVREESGREANETLIASIRNAASKEKRDPDAGSFKPDPSPRGIMSSRSDSALEMKKGSTKKMKKSPHKDKYDVSKSLSEGAYDERDDLQYTESTSKDAKSSSCVPENAILASMLFRQTQSNMETNISVPNKRKVKASVLLEKDHPIEVPPSIHASDETESNVSSVTEDASSFYQKHFQSWKSQAHSVLNHYNNAKFEKQKSVLASVKNQRVGGSSLTSTAGRPTWLDRVEEEHMRMFNE